MFERDIKNVYIVCSNVQNIYEDLIKTKDVKKIFYEMPTENEILDLAQIGKKKGGTILILDDILPEIEKASNFIQKLFTETCHHNDMSVFLCVQNLFYNNGVFRTLSRNAGYLIPFKNPRDKVTFIIKFLLVNFCTNSFLFFYSHTIETNSNSRLSSIRQEP